MKAALADSGIFYCYLDDFYSGNAERYQTQRALSGNVPLD